MVALGFVLGGFIGFAFNRKRSGLFVCLFIAAVLGLIELFN